MAPASSKLAQSDILTQLSNLLYDPKKVKIIINTCSLVADVWRRYYCHFLALKIKKITSKGSPLALKGTLEKINRSRQC